MALFSDIDWIILAAAALFLLLGKDSGPLLRTAGRWYARAGRLKQEILAEFTKAAELPAPPGGGPLSIRGMLLGLDSPPTPAHGIPTAVPAAPLAARASAPAVTSAVTSAASPRPLVPAWAPWTGGYPTPIWSTTVALEVPPREEPG